MIQYLLMSFLLTRLPVAFIAQSSEGGRNRNGQNFSGILGFLSIKQVRQSYTAKECYTSICQRYARWFLPSNR